MTARRLGHNITINHDLDLRKTLIVVQDKYKKNREDDSELRSLQKFKKDFVKKLKPNDDDYGWTSPLDDRFSTLNYKKSTNKRVKKSFNFENINNGEPPYSQAK